MKVINEQGVQRLNLEFIILSQDEDPRIFTMLELSEIFEKAGIQVGNLNYNFPVRGQYTMVLTLPKKDEYVGN